MLSTSEGGWRRIKWDSEPTYGDYSELRKPLPPPPPGLEWRRLSDGRWELSSTRDESGEASTAPDPGPAAPADKTDPEPAADGEEIAIHVVLPSDTLAGLCLRYKTTPDQIRRLNGGNCDLRAVARVRVALRGSRARRARSRQDADSHDVKLAQLRHSCHLSLPEAEYYLGEHGGRLDAACAAARADAAWEAEQLAAREAANQARLPLELDDAPPRSADGDATFCLCGDAGDGERGAGDGGRPFPPRHESLEAMRSDDPLSALESPLLGAAAAAGSASDRNPVGFL